jgi:hypothetical protein
MAALFCCLLASLVAASLVAACGMTECVSQEHIQQPGAAVDHESETIFLCLALTTAIFAQVT